MNWKMKGDLVNGIIESIWISLSRKSEAYDKPEIFVTQLKKEMLSVLTAHIDVKIHVWTKIIT